MKTIVRRPLSIRLFAALILAALIAVPVASRAQNTAYGYGALFYNSTGYQNTAFGYEALFSNTVGDYNTAEGFQALYSNLTGFGNTANGTAVLFSNTTGYQNTAEGSGALNSNTTGYANTAEGRFALHANTIGFDNTATGWNVLISNTTGSYNTANGDQALYSNTTGAYNTAEGYYALYSNITGNNNIALGNGAGQNIATGSNNIAIGNSALLADDGVIRIGTVGTQKATYIAGIDGAITGRGVEVLVNGLGQLGTLRSSRRFKNNIKDMGSVSDKLMNLRPVTFRYKDSAEKGPHLLQYGLIAEEVARIYPDLVQYDKQGKPFTIYYHLLTPMLLNELQKEHRQNVAMKTAFTTQKAEIMAMRAMQKVEVTALKAELTSLKQEHEQELKTLAKLSAFVQTAQARETQQKVAFVQH